MKANRLEGIAEGEDCDDLSQERVHRRIKDAKL